MLKSMQYSILCVIAALGVALVAVNAVLYFSNRVTQAHVTARARYIEQSQSIGTLYQEIARALASLAIQHHDDEATALLKQEGITINRPAASGSSTSGNQKEARP
jgi:hypothetical protein